MEPWQRITLIAAGAGAGIAATFNTPIGGVMFAIELMMPEVSVRTFLPVALATGTATFVGNWFLGPQPAFAVPLLPLARPPAVIDDRARRFMRCSARSWAWPRPAFVRGLSAAEDLFERIRNPYLRHADRHAAGRHADLSRCFIIYGHYFVEGVGYSTIQAVLTGNDAASTSCRCSIVAKLAATSISLGSGASGGIFSPSLYHGRDARRRIRIAGQC